MESDLLFINDDVMLDIDNNQDFENVIVENHLFLHYVQVV